MSSQDWQGVAALGALVAVNIGLLIYRLRHPETVTTRHYGCEGGSCSIPKSLPEGEEEDKQA